MSATASIEQRLEAVERALAELQSRVGNGIPADDWLKRFKLSFKDEPAFAEVVAYGRAIRAADRPDESPEP